MYTIEVSDPEKEKREGFRGGGAYFYLRVQKVGYGMVADGFAKFQALKFTLSAWNFQ